MHRCIIQCIVLSVCFIPFQIHTSYADYELKIVLPKALRKKPHVVATDDVVRQNLSRPLLDAQPVEINVARHKTVTIGELIVDDVPVIQQESTEKRSVFCMIACCCNCCRK